MRRLLVFLLLVLTVAASSPETQRRLRFAPAAGGGGGTMSGPFGEWENVTPADMTLDVNGTHAGAGVNFGSQGVCDDPTEPGVFYTWATYQKLWKSVDYGKTWSAVTITGDNPFYNARPSMQCAPDGSYLLSTGLYPVNGLSNGAWKSTNGGQTWTRYNVGVVNGDDIGGFSILSSDSSRVLGSAHSEDGFFESRDGGETWSEHSPAGDTVFADYQWIDADTIIAIGEGDNGPGPGTWRGVRSGSTWPWTWSWTEVSTQQHWHGASQIYIDPSNGYIYLGGGYGIQRSTNNGVSWTVVDNALSGGIVGTGLNLYSTANYASQSGFGPFLMYSTRAAGNSWTADTGAPGTLNNGWLQAGTGTDGVRWVVVSGNWNAGVWRYAED